ncbi:MAG: single-stranded-DNA-specific exonuclease RecJ [Leptotrichiaceae bacterium]|nr:single-stranded-DNA-specific exonuclease RecJ [Leptotrichiaceae bacterium]MBP6281436.1 single-stranded-DNA-specific exonuclease RecJ [Leptotrichiaceae bacterium]MBP7100750.1 single-stranded-DNA-specific exonuclease RecJ [Leptotrichiaceae bacterium]MBP7739712.1 single-stranded-DNA-specific exonuclease RecJ [Leptotrichiaceae bacterium]MBP9629695.1 single-stranded-DNA-specific exonuclease RecJ [Leptotrichiaceae bacterium]
MKWELKNYDDDYLKFKSEEFHENELITRLLLNRSIISKKEVENFLNSGDESLHDPFLFEQMEEVVDRILQARNNKEKVIIYGDYDVDGISGTAYLVIILRKLGMNVDYYIPNRAHEGVGINKNFLKYLIKRNTRLIITVDTSISTSEEILMLKSNNIDIIITDHHRPVNNIAEFNLLTVNPKISKKYPNKNLSGSGVAFKLATAIYEKLGMSKKIIFEYIDIVMIGTVADVVPMIDENRYIIKKGLYNLRKTKVKGLKYIINYVKINPKNMTASDIGFYIAPIFNALGRIDNSKMVVEFFIQEDYYDIFSIIEEMKKANKIRRYLELEIYSEIEDKIQKLKNPKYIFMKSRKWHSGVIGVVCSRISIKYNIPVILISLKNGYGKASCRSIEGLNIFEMLKEISHKFERFGGHDLAAGFLVSEKYLNDIEKYLKNRLLYANKLNVEKILSIDSKLSIEEINKNKLLNINRLSPFGLYNHEPNFLDNNISFINFTKFGVNNRHFKGFIKKNKRIISVIGYNLGHKLKIRNVHKKYEIVYTPIFKSVRTDLFIELKIKDFK